MSVISPCPPWATDSEPISYFELPWTHTWGTNRNVERKAQGRDIVSKLGIDPTLCEWFAFYIVVHTSPRPGGGPDADNHFKPITDALTGILYPDDDVRYVRATAADTRLTTPDRRRTQVWIYAKRM